MNAAIKNLLKPAYYLLGLDRNLHWYMKQLGLNTERHIQIGSVRLLLDRAVKHENAYYVAHKRGVKDMDELLISHLLRPNDTVLDAGANIGFTAALFAKYGASSVHCFEPVSSVFHKLSRLDHEAIFRHQIALSDHEGRESIFVSSRHNQGSSLKGQFLTLFPYVFDDPDAREEISVATLDSFMPEVSFDYMKIDIEGSEADFLRGARKHLENRRPRVLHIESYPLCFSETNDLLRRHYKHCARISISQSQGIAILDLSATPQGYEWTDNYVYFNDPTACPLGFVH